jgi:hypothetical protein
MGQRWCVRVPKLEYNCSVVLTLFLRGGKSPDAYIHCFECENNDAGCGRVMGPATLPQGSDVPWSHKLSNFSQCVASSCIFLLQHVRRGRTWIGPIKRSTRTWIGLKDVSSGSLGKTRFRALEAMVLPYHFARFSIGHYRRMAVSRGLQNGGRLFSAPVCGRCRYLRTSYGVVRTLFSHNHT